MSPIRRTGPEPTSGAPDRDAGGARNAGPDLRTGSGCYTAAPGVIVTDIGEELIVLDPERGEMYSLNETGRCVWQALGCGVDAAVDALTAAFEVDPESARAEVHTLIAALIESGLLLSTDETDDHDT